MQSERQKKSWRDIDRLREKSMHRSENRDRARRHERTAQANAIAKQHRKALEALFSAKEPTSEQKKTIAKVAPRIVLTPNPDTDPNSAQRQRLLAKLLAASGSSGITKAADEFSEAGFELPPDQDVYVQLLEHNDELRVRQAIEMLAALLAGQIPKRRAVIEQRLRRIEEQADDPRTRDAAASLRRLLHGVGTGAVSYSGQSNE